MGQTITFNNLDSSTVDWIYRTASEQHKSPEAVITQLIAEKAAPRSSNDSSAPACGQEVYHDLDFLAGTWTEAETTEFLKAVADFGRVDESLWQ